jgi:archaellum component FlaC
MTYVDRMVQLVKGSPVQATTAEVKVRNAFQAVQPVLGQAQSYISLPMLDPNAVDPNAAGTTVVDPNKVALTRVARNLIDELQQIVDQRQAVQSQLDELRQKYDAAVATMQETKQNLTAQVEDYRRQVEQIKSDYDDLRTLLEQNSEQRVANLLKQLEDERANSRQLNQDLLRTQAELDVAQERLSDAMAKVGEIAPPPDREAEAFSPDGKVVLVDEPAGIIHINLGAEDRVYQGLTFSIYDQASRIPKDGEPKAEVEVFAVDPKTSTARILTSEQKNPVARGDIVANLIWDSAKENQFVIAGEFDLDEDGQPEFDGAERIQLLVEKWGGAVAESVGAKTDFVILGEEPQVPPEPTLDQLDEDPTAMQRYEAAQERLARYEQIRQRAQDLWIPIFNYDRFLHFTGYASQVGRPGAF